MKNEFQEKLSYLTNHIESLTDDALNSAEFVDSLIVSAYLEIITLDKEKVTIERGNRFIRFSESDIPPGLIIPLAGKMFEYVLYKVPFDGSSALAQRLLTDISSPSYQSISNNELKIAMYYNGEIASNPAVEERIKLIAQNSIDRFEKACIDYNAEATSYNTMMESSIKSKLDSERQKRRLS